MLLEEPTIVKYEMNFPRHNWTTNGFWKLVKTISLSILKQIIIIIDTTNLSTLVLLYLSISYIENSVNSEQLVSSEEARGSTMF